MASSALLFVITLCVAACNAGLVPGGCPAVTLQQNFDIKSYLGRWYQYKAFLSPYGQGRCDYAEYSDNLNGTIGVFGYTINLNTAQKMITTGFATLNSTVGEGQLSISYPQNGPNFENLPYYVLGTDYTGYAVVFVCTLVGENSYHHSSLITRARQPSASILAEAQKVIDANGFNSTWYAITDQTNCQK